MCHRGLLGIHLKFIGKGRAFNLVYGEVVMGIFKINNFIIAENLLFGGIADLNGELCIGAKKEAYNA